MGARSPQAPTEPFSHTTGVTPLLSMSTKVWVISGRQPELPVGVDVDPPDHGRPDVLDGSGLADAGGVVVDQVALELLDLLVGQHHLGELPDAGVDPIHDLVGRDLLVQHGPAGPDPVQRLRRQCHLLALAGDADDLIDSELGTTQDGSHANLQKEMESDGWGRKCMYSRTPRPARKRPQHPIAPGGVRPGNGMGRPEHCGLDSRNQPQSPKPGR